jgi:hypothetical protein
MIAGGIRVPTEVCAGANSVAKDTVDRPAEEPSPSSAATVRLHSSLSTKLSYGLRVLPIYAWQKLTRPSSRGRVHLIIALADHFEPSIVPENGSLRAPYPEQERRVDSWCRAYPRLAEAGRDSEGRPFVHTYFCPAEQYDRRLTQQLAELCHTGFGEIEIHLHHGIPRPDTMENTRRQLVEFRNTLAADHDCLSYRAGSGPPMYAFVHGDFALANSAGGKFCGVDDEMQVLADTGCYADFTLPTAPLHPAQIAKINSLYECALPLNRQSPHRKGRDLEQGRAPTIFPLIVQGPLLPQFLATPSRLVGIENGAITKRNPLSLARLPLWKRAAISVRGVPDWLFIKLHCHGMDPTQQDAVSGAPMRDFMRELVQGAEQRNEVLHFVSAREMVNIILAACDGRDGNPGEYRDYCFRRLRTSSHESAASPGKTAVKI